MAPNEPEFHESDQKFLTPGLLRPQTPRFSAVGSCRTGEPSPSLLTGYGSQGNCSATD